MLIEELGERMRVPYLGNLNAVYLEFSVWMRLFSVEDLLYGDGS